MWLSTVANDAKAAGQEARAAIAAVKELRAELRQDLRGDFGAIQNEIVSLREDATKNKIEVLSRLSVVESRVLQAKEDR